MPVSYNLRSSQKKKKDSVNHCYLQNILRNSSPDVFNPKVRLERLKLLECHDLQNSRFYLERGKISLKQNDTRLPKKKFLLKIFFTIILLVATSLFWKDYLQSYSIIFAKNYEKLYPSIQSYYYDALKFQQKILKMFDYKQHKLYKENRKTLPSNHEEEFSDFEIRKLVRDYFQKDAKKYKIRSTEKPPEAFIEDQCKINARDEIFSSVKNNFYNVTVSELAKFTDYALESQGARIESTFNTELYVTITVLPLNFNLSPKVAQFLMEYFGCFSSNGPNSILVPWKKPGDCWAFKGSEGKVQIKLSKKIIITAITVDHIPKDVAPPDSIQSAPKKFSVIGIEKCKTYLGSFEYESSGPPSQTFLINPKVEVPFEKIEILIESNHGNDKYTCIYKIRVHGY